MLKLPEVTTANGYKTDCGNNVQLVKTKIAPEDLPALIVWPQEETAEQKPHGKILITWPVRIEGLSGFGSVLVYRFLYDDSSRIQHP